MSNGGNEQDLVHLMGGHQLLKKISLDMIPADGDAATKYVEQNPSWAVELWTAIEALDWDTDSDALHAPASHSSVPEKAAIRYVALNAARRLPVSEIDRVIALATSCNDGLFAELVANGVTQNENASKQQVVAAKSIFDEKRARRLLVGRVDNGTSTNQEVLDVYGKLIDSIDSAFEDGVVDYDEFDKRFHQLMEIAKAHTVAADEIYLNLVAQDWPVIDDMRTKGHSELAELFRIALANISPNYIEPALQWILNQETSQFTKYFYAGLIANPEVDPRHVQECFDDMVSRVVDLVRQENSMGETEVAQSISTKLGAWLFRSRAEAGTIHVHGGQSAMLLTGLDVVNRYEAKTRPDETNKADTAAALNSLINSCAHLGTSGAVGLKATFEDNIRRHM